MISTIAGVLSWTSKRRARAKTASPERTALTLPQRRPTVGRPRRSSAPSITSSWTRVAMWIISAATATGIAFCTSSVKRRAERRTRSGRTRLPPPWTRWSAICRASGGASSKADASRASVCSMGSWTRATISWYWARLPFWPVLPFPAERLVFEVVGKTLQLQAQICMCQVDMLRRGHVDRREVEDGPGARSHAPINDLLRGRSGHGHHHHADALPFQDLFQAVHRLDDQVPHLLPNLLRIRVEEGRHPQLVVRVALVSVHAVPSQRMAQGAHADDSQVDNLVEIQDAQELVPQVGNLVPHTLLPELAEPSQILPDQSGTHPGPLAQFLRGHEPLVTVADRLIQDPQVEGKAAHDGVGNLVPAHPILSLVTPPSASKG